MTLLGPHSENQWPAAFLGTGVAGEECTDSWHRRDLKVVHEMKLRFELPLLEGSIVTLFVLAVDSWY